MLVAKARVDGQIRSDLPGVLHEQRLVVLRGVGHVAGVCPIDAVDLSVGRIGQDLDLGARGRDGPVRQRKRRAGTVDRVDVVEVLGVDAVAKLMTTNKLVDFAPYCQLVLWLPTS